MNCERPLTAPRRPGPFGGLVANTTTSFPPPSDGNHASLNGFLSLPVAPAAKPRGVLASLPRRARIGSWRGPGCLPSKVHLLYDTFNLDGWGELFETVILPGLAAFNEAGGGGREAPQQS